MHSLPSSNRLFPFLFFSSSRLIFFRCLFSCSLNPSSASKVYINCTPNHIRHRSNRGKRLPNSGPGGNSFVSPAISPLHSPKPSPRGSTLSFDETALNTPPGSPSLSGQHWKNRLSTLKSSFMGSPRFHRRKMQGKSHYLTLYLTIPFQQPVKQTHKRTNTT